MLVLNRKLESTECTAYLHRQLKHAFADFIFNLFIFFDSVESWLQHVGSSLRRMYSLVVVLSFSNYSMQAPKHAGFSSCSRQA